MDCREILWMDCGGVRGKRVGRNIPLRDGRFIPATARCYYGILFRGGNIPTTNLSHGSL